MSLNRILIISYMYSPHITPRALRWSAIAEYLSRQGFAVDVLCAWDPGSPRLETRNGVRVHRIGSAFIERLRTKLLGRTAFNMDTPQVPQKTAAGEKTGNTAIATGAKRLAKVIHDATWKKVYWPDYAVLWYPKTFKYAKALAAESRHDALITIAPPFTGHLIGLGLKKRFPSIRWIADSGDPFCFAEFSTMNTELLYARLNRYAEGRVFTSADGLSVTTEETARIYAGLFPFAEERINVIPPLVNPDCLGSSRTKKGVHDDRKIRLVYIGNFHRRLREPEVYIRTIERAISYSAELAGRIEMHFLGDAALVEESLEESPSVKNLCRFHGRSSRKAVLDALQAANVFVNIGNATHYQLPSKVIEYACFGKPILNFSSSTKDSSAAFLSTYPLLKSIQGKASDTDGRKVAEFLLARSHERMQQAEIDEFIRPYTVENIARRYLCLLQDASLAKTGGRARVTVRNDDHQHKGSPS